jgi:hypothetical protein
MVLKASPKRRLSVRAFQEGKASASPLFSAQGVQRRLQGVQRRRLGAKSPPCKNLDASVLCAGNFGLAGGENRNGGLGGKLRAIYRGKRGKRERGSSSHATSPTLARSAAAPSSAGLPSSGQASGQASGDSSHWCIPLPEGKQCTASMTASLGALVVSGVCM